MLRARDSGAAWPVLWHVAGERGQHIVASEEVLLLLQEAATVGIRSGGGHGIRVVDETVVFEEACGNDSARVGSAPINTARCGSGL